MFDGHIGKMYDGQPEIVQLTVEQNIKRISYISYCFVAFQLFNQLNQQFYERWYMAAGSIAATVICVIYTIYTLARYTAIVESPKKAKFVNLSFWILFIILGGTPFFLLDIELDRPVNITLFLAALTIVPMFSKHDIISVFSIIGLYNIGLSMLFGADLGYIAFVCGVSIAGGCFAFLIQQRYLDLIVKFKKETRVDPLTKTLNRRGGLDKMHTVIELCKRHGMSVVVYMIDIDYFKDYNDCYGHIRGDQVLIEISREIQHIFSRSSDVVCRFGGEEFVVCSSVANIRNAHDMAKLLRASIEELGLETARKDLSNYLTVSVGYTIYKPQGYNVDADMDAMSLIEEADAALYAAKNSGRNTVYSFVSTSQTLDDINSAENTG